MKTVDYLVVGCGLAGISFIENVKGANKSVMVFDNHSQQSSSVAGGMYNPVTLKRFTPVWKSKEQLTLTKPFYKQLEDKLGVDLDFKLPVLRRFVSLEEQNNWFAATDKPNLGEFMSTQIVKNNNPSIDAEFGFGEVLHTGRIDTGALISNYKKHLKNAGELIEKGFDYDELKPVKPGFIYKDIQTKYIVFTEGYGLKQNPFFNTLPLQGSKGELLIIHAPELKLDFLLKSGVFIMPLGEDLYKVGATYERNDKTNLITNEAKNQLVSKLKAVIQCDFKVVNQVAGIRPTVKDRRPLVGEHKEIKNMFILNGLGSRGVLIGPYVAKQLFSAIETGSEIDSEIDIKRFNT